MLRFNRACPQGTDNFIRPNGNYKTPRKLRSSTLRHPGNSPHTNVPKFKPRVRHMLEFANTCPLACGMIH